MTTSLAARLDEPVEPDEPVDRSGALLVLQTFVWLIAILPGRLVIGPLGSFGAPAAVVGFLSFGIWAVGALSRGLLARKVWPVRWALIALAAPTLLSYAFMHLNSSPTDEVNGSDRALLYLAIWSGVALLACEGLRNRDELVRLLRVLASAVAFVAAVAVVQARFGFDLTIQLAKLPGLETAGELDSVLSRSGFRRPAGTATHPIELGCVLGTVLGIAIVLAIYDHGWAKWRRWAVLGVICLGIPSSISRSSVIAGGITLVVFMAGTTAAIRLRTMVLTGFFGVLLFLTTPGLIGTLYGWFANAKTDQSISTRTDDYAAVAKYIRRSPWIGRGPSTFLPKFRILDNQWLLSLIEVGIVGTVGVAIYLGLPGVIGSMARSRSDDPLLRGLSQAMIGISLVAIASSASYDSFSYPMYPGILALLLGTAGMLWHRDHVAAPTTG